jgi:hypothetical protein
LLLFIFVLVAPNGLYVGYNDAIVGTNKAIEEGNNEAL